MKICFRVFDRVHNRHVRPGFSGIFVLLMLSLAQCESRAAGTWAALASAPPTGVNHAMVLSDGTILTDNGNGDCCRLTPDIHGSYRNGTWTRLASMNNSRMFFASSVLTNGNVFVAGGEYGAGRRHAELYDPLNNAWTKIPDPIPGPAFSDAIGKILPNGNVFVAPVSKFGGCLIYNVVANTWQAAASAANQNETCWVKLANDTIITIDTGSVHTEHYVPSSDTWVTDGDLPLPLYGYGAELGAGFLLPNGKVFYIGGTTNTAIYTAGATPNSAGSWAASATIPNGLGAVDAPAAMMVNGKVLCVLGPADGFNGPCSFYEYDYTADTFTQVGAPGGGSTYGSSAPFGTSLLDLPDGTVLFIGGQNSQSLYVYTPDGTPLAAGKPVINNITENADGSYHLTGTGLNGITEGAAYGDDEQMDSNYPLVRMTNGVSGNVYYARTYNWNSTSVQTGSRVIATEFILPQNLPAGTYSLVAEANGNPSAPRTFTYSPPGVPGGLTAVSGSN
ncbi:MAG TPA: kelch repeat-containing protein, partial [Candidatus Binatia bacterium]|nr:kelch repeat-containing protein [Candidatus Binatia bacterium]